MYRQRMRQELCNALNRQINLELQASYVYLDLATYFSRSDVALPGFAKFFAKESQEERDHAQQVIDYQILRGNEVEFDDLPYRRPDQLGHPKDAVRIALELEHEVTDSIYKLIDVASTCEDHHSEDWLTDFGSHQLEAIRELKTLQTQLERVGDGEGLFHLDEDLLKRVN